MQTLQLCLRDLRAISPGRSPGRWRTPSMLVASSRKSAPPLPDHLRPTWAVGSPVVPQSVARSVAPRWRWSRLPGAGAERRPGPGGPGAASGAHCTHCMCCRPGHSLPLVRNRMACQHRGTVTATPGSGGSGDASGAVQALLRPRSGCPVGRDRAARESGAPLPLTAPADVMGPACPAPAGLSLLPVLRSVWLAPSCGSRPAVSVRAGCFPGLLQDLCRIRNPGGRSGGRASVRAFPMEVAWPAITSR